MAPYNRQVAGLVAVTCINMYCYRYLILHTCSDEILKSCLSLLSGVNARGSRRSSTCVICSLIVVTETIPCLRLMCKPNPKLDIHVFGLQSYTFL